MRYGLIFHVNHQGLAGWFIQYQLQLDNLLCNVKAINYLCTLNFY